ncbi:hypothetical protein CPJCM30710_09820 [Clostridium polyendosporum]|uniref:Uncharacterized protein n=1 Tax=Clostridium polyendosporum TaxID=69208 RepID=A0A919RZ02_9CLOT|nr:hypothetical protein [Clostridium polyendosporum]GIM28316.1 hypothetical protein CPJCM30710_09820 [Clostridium polyendosporum]
MSENYKAVVELRSKYEALLKKAAKLGACNLRIDKDSNIMGCGSGMKCSTGDEFSDERRK